MEDDFLKTHFSYAIVVRASIDDIQKLKEYLAKNEMIICFQKTSTNKLWIKEGMGGDNDTYKETD